MIIKCNKQTLYVHTYNRLTDNDPPKALSFGFVPHLKDLRRPNLARSAPMDCSSSSNPDVLIGFPTPWQPS